MIIENGGLGKYLTPTESEGVLVQRVTTASPTNGTTVCGGKPTIDRTMTKQSNNGQIQPRVTFGRVDLKNTSQLWTDVRGWQVSERYCGKSSKIYYQRDDGYRVGI